MTKKKGKVLYVPKVVIMELEDIAREDKIENKADCFKELTKYARVGREAKRLMNLDFRRASQLPSIGELLPKKARKWR